VIEKLLGLTGERYQLWPERSIRSGATLARDMITGAEQYVPGLRREDVTDKPRPGGWTIGGRAERSRHRACRRHGRACHGRDACRRTSWQPCGAGASERVTAAPSSSNRQSVFAHAGRQAPFGIPTVHNRSAEAPERIDLGPITAEGVQHINSVFHAAGVDIDVTGFRHHVDAFAARHAFKQHGIARAEELRGQLPVTADDWAMIPEVPATPDHIVYTGKTGIGRESIGYWKAINGVILYLEEVRTGRSTLSATSMRKFKRAPESEGAGTTR
jgi:Barnase-EndoU-ColicinE5/D-RelE like nuclease